MWEDLACAPVEFLIGQELGEGFPGRSSEYKGLEAQRRRQVWYGWNAGCMRGVARAQAAKGYLTEDLLGC